MPTDAAQALYQLKVRLGNAEFEANGPEDVVKLQFDRFMEIASNFANSPSTNGPARSGQSDANIGESEDNESMDPAQWDRAFMRKGNKLSLQVLPKSKAVNADSLLLLLYGYNMILDMGSVKSTDLMEAAKQSGVRIDRIDRNLPASHMQYIIKGGNGKGSRYSLNNRGLKAAQDMLETMFD